MSEKQQFINKRIICRGGLISTKNWLDLNDNFATFASRLVNYEPSLIGGYRRINGFEPLSPEEPEVDPTGAEGRIFIVAVFGSTIITARKQQSGNTYDFYEYVPSTGWVKHTTGLTLSSVGVTKIRYDTWNFDGTDCIGFVDGVNGLIIYDGTSWTQVQADVTNTQMLDDVRYISVFQNHIFLSGSPTYPHLVIHSAPEDAEDFSPGGGAGQLIAGFGVINIKPFRDELYVFGNLKIKKIVVENTTFLVRDVTEDIGCIAPDSIVELNGDIVFLAQDGFRPISATERIGDIELALISKNIQSQLLNMSAVISPEDVDSVLIRNKSQVRWFFSTESTDESIVPGVITGIQQGPNGPYYEWGLLRGIKTSCSNSSYIDTVEYVLHGTYDGYVMRQEIGNTFNGTEIESVFQTPYLDFGDSELRKTFRNIRIFTAPEGELEVDMGIDFDWGSPDVQSVPNYHVDIGESGGTYGSAIYGISIYGGSVRPSIITPVEGSGFAIQVSIIDRASSAPYSIQAIVIEFNTDGRE